MTTDTLTLDNALEGGALYLERASQWADRYQLTHGESAYFCRDCGLEIQDALEGCEHCGFGRADEMEEMAA
jgi:ribosomal protein L37E